LLGFALVINSSILILAGAAFYYNSSATGEPDIPGAFNLISSMIGNGAGIVFAVALLCVSLPSQTRSSALSHIMMTVDDADNRPAKARR